MMKMNRLMLVLLLTLALLLGCSALAWAGEWQTVLCEGQELNDVRNIVETEQGFWVCTKGGLFFVSSAGQVQRMFVNELKTQFVYDIAPDDQGNYYITQGFTYSGGVNYGILKISADGELLAQYTAENSGLLDDFVQAVEVDANGLLWAGSGMGLSCLDPATDTWTTYTKQDGLAASAINTLVQDGAGGLWIGHYPDGQQGGLAGPFTGGYSYLSADKKLIAYAYAGDEQHDSFLLGDFWTRGIAVDAEGKAYIIRSGAAANYFENPGYLGADGQPIPIEKCVGGRLDMVDAAGNIIHTTGRELFSLIDEGIKPADPATEYSGATPELRMAAIGPDGALWLGTSGAGLFRYVQGEEETQFASSNCAAFANAFFDNIYALTMLSDGTLAVGSQGGLRLLSADTPPPGQVQLSRQSLSVDGEEVHCLAYNIDGSNYFKLRDIAALLQDTPSRFSVTYDEAERTVLAVAGEQYQPDGGELQTAAAAQIKCVVSSQRTLFNGQPSGAWAYNINGNNYYKLRDAAAALAFSVDYNAEADRVEIKTAKAGN